MKQEIEQLAETIVLIDPSDLQALGEIHSRFEELVEMAADASLPMVASAGAAAAGLVEQIILHEVDDATATLATINEAITSLQAIIDGRSPEDVTFPEALGPISSDYSRDDAGAGASQEAEPTESEEPDPASLEPVPLTGDPELTPEFVSEAMEHLESADTHLLVVDSDPANKDAINAVFRAFHTIKGVAGFLELQDIQTLAHEAESLLDCARTDKIVLKGPSMNVTFDAVDSLKQLVGFVRTALESGGLVERLPVLGSLIKRIQAAKTGDNADRVLSSNLKLSRKIGEILVQQKVITEEDLAQALKHQKDQGERHILIGEILINNQKATADQINAALRAQADERAGVSPPTPASPSPTPANDSTAPAASSTKQAQPAAATGAATKGKAVRLAETVRVDAGRLDAMIDSVGELVIAQAMVSQSPELQASGSTNLKRLMNQLEKITRELQDMATSLRMMPIRQTFQRMARLVHDVARKIGKQVEFSMTGEDTELDKSVVEQIADPLVHMVRNSVDHGIEPDVDERRAAGKPDAGRVELRAFHRGGSIHIEIEDDGRGLNREAILKKAKQNGVVRDGDSLTDYEIDNLIFEPGLSTAKSVSDVSGRGVGMDVVKRNIQALRGQIDIQSTPGKGSIFSIRLPLTLAIIEGMVVRVGSQRFILPLLLITRMLRPEEHDIPTAFGKAEMLSVSDGLIPLYRLHDIFHIDDAQKDAQQAAVVVVEHDGRRFGLLVDELIGQQQTVIKSLGESLKNTEGIAGGAIMPDGLVGLIIDMDSLVKTVTSGDSPIPQAA